MKTVKSLLFCLICTVFTVSCNLQNHYLSKEERLVNNLLAKTANIVKIKYNLTPSGSSASMPGGPIRKLSLCFNTQYPHTQDQLRELLLKSADELVIQVNRSNEIQEYLNEPPFTIKNVQIIIYNHDEEGQMLYDPQILTAELSNNILTYRTAQSDGTLKLKQQFTETYEEALKRISKAC